MDRFRKRFSDCFSLIVISLVIVCLLFIKDTGTAAAVRFLATVFTVSFCMRPYFPAGKLMFPDGAFALCFGCGLAVCFYVCWTFCALTGFEYSDTAVYAAFILLAFAGYFINRFILCRRYFVRDDFSDLLTGFAVFAVIFLVFFHIIGFNPLVDPGTENYMDFGFMQTIYRQKSAIISDPWFAGEKLNYYYLGQAAAVYMCRLSHVTPEYGYNLMLAAFIALVFTCVYEIVYALSAGLLPGYRLKSLTAKAGGVFGAICAAFGANPHWIIFGPLLLAAKKLLGTDDGERYWFPDGTVYINAGLGDADNGKNEFPAYSVILGDLHAHVINLIFVLPLLAILFSYGTDDDRETSPKKIYTLLLISVMLGMFKGSNYWDFAIYYVICGAVTVFTDIKRRGMSLATLGIIAVKACAVTAVSTIAILPFTINFVKMESGIEICDTHSPLIKMLVLWGPALIFAVSLIWLMFANRKNEGCKTEAIRPAVLAMTLCTIGLVIVPELLYVKDIYGGDNKRFNTMFKLTYQAFVLFAIISGITFSLLLYRALTVNGKREKRFGVRSRGAVTAVCIAAVYCILAASYTAYAVHQRYGNVFDVNSRLGISSLEGLRGDASYGFEMAAYDHLMKDTGKNVNIIEASGDSYTHQSALSVYTGTCTALGWYVHEWMWHNDSEPVHERADLVSYFYTSGNEEFCRNFIRTYDIDYIFVGPAEVCKYPVNRNGFWRLGDVCTETIWQDCDLALIKVDHSRL